ncbi:MAG: hypothetical protein HFH82_11170 [Lachnospiraceae bacterium]|nr:hypothetical protein [Lachnospiraceae bacterium]
MRRKRKRHQILSLALSAAMLATSVAPSQAAYAAGQGVSEQNLVNQSPEDQEDFENEIQTEISIGGDSDGILQPPEDNGAESTLDVEPDVTTPKPGNSNQEPDNSEDESTKTELPEDIKESDIPQGTDGPQTSPEGVQGTDAPQTSPEGVQGNDAPQTSPEGVQGTDAPQTSPEGVQGTDAPQTLPGTGQTSTVPSGNMSAVSAVPSVIAETEKHVATYVGGVPEIEGVTWADGVTADNFATAFQTVKVKDNANVEYTVEVIPENLVYFIDSYDMGAGAGSKPYEAVKALVGEGLLNDSYEQMKSDDNTWGLVAAAKVKGKTTATDKDDTGLYGNDEVDSTIAYEFALPAGKYTLTSFHKEWWPSSTPNRPMKLSVTGENGTQLVTGQVSVGTNTVTNSWSGQFTITKAQTVKFTVKAADKKAPAISWLAVVQDEVYQELDPGQEPTRPTSQLPAGYNRPLEDNDGVEAAEKADISLVTGFKNMINVSVQWNNQNQGHASIKEAPNLFKKKTFTVLLDVEQTAPTADTNRVDQRVALSIGNAGNSLHLLTWSGKFGYGADNGGVSNNMVNMDYVEQGGWNALAMTYEEKDDGKTAVTVYANGKQAAVIEDVGFKLSDMGDLKAMLARTFNTNYLQQGTYDNLIVFDSVVGSDVLCQETYWRKWKKENPGMNTLELETAIQEAEALIAVGITSDELTTALAEAKDLLTSDSQEDINAGAAKLKKVLEALTPGEIVIKGGDVDTAAGKVNGLSYKGFGMLNGNSTSNLLLDYKAENPDKYWEMMHFLFDGPYPLFTHIKMEMGNDGNNSTGAEACTMRSADDIADASRSPGFVMAADAKKINPDVKVSILRWGYPNWVKDAGFKENSDTEAGYEEMYIWYRDTIFDAYEKYGYMVDFVNPDKNETGSPDGKFIKWYKERILREDAFPDYMDELAQEAYKSIRIIASDENKGLKIVPLMRNDADLYNTVDIIGFHYRTNATDDYVRMADEDDKEVWYSEGCATFGYSELQETKTSEYGYESIGGYQSPLALMDSFITAFASSRRTHYIFQPAIGSFYEGIQYGHKELLSARDPWSGYIHYDPALCMLEHFAKFAKLGWEDENQTKGIWRAIPQSTQGAFAGTDNEHATAGIDGKAGYLTLASPDKQDFTVIFVNNTQNSKTFRIKAEDMAVDANQALHKWVTETKNYLQDGGEIACVDGSWIVSIPAYSVVTATTLTDAEAAPVQTPEERIHNDDRTVLDTGATGRGQDLTDDILYADDFDYADEPDMPQYSLIQGESSVPYIKARGNEPRYMLDTHGAWIVENNRLKQALDSSVSQWNGGDPATIVGDFRWMDYSVEIQAQIPDAGSSSWVGLGIRTQTGMNWNQSGYTLRMNGAGSWELYRVGTKVADGSVDASADGGYTLFLMGLGDTVTAAVDGKIVAIYQDANPMLSGRVKLSSTWSQVTFDNLVVKKVKGGIPYALSMIDGQDESVIYEGNWTIDNPGGGSADDWYRTVSKGSQGAAFGFKVNGDGFALIGSNDSTVKLDVYVDGALKDSDVAVTAVPRRYEAYSMSDLGMKEHDVRVVVKEGTFNLDAIYGLGEREAADNDAVAEIVTELPRIAVAAEDVEAAEGKLPAQVKVRTVGGQEKDLDVVWNIDKEALADKLFKSAVITGTVQGAKNVAGLDVVVSVPVEVVSKDTVYFIDTVTGFKADDAKVDTTESFEAVKELVGNRLLNQVYDQLKTADNTWGLVDQDAGTKGFTSTTDKTATGIYGAQNKTGETLSYAFTLPAGNYTLYSGHSEWWNMNRPMSASLNVDGTDRNAGTINLNGSSGDLVNRADFTVDQDGVVTYTLTATGSQAPVISWLAVMARASEEEPERPIAQLPAGYDQPLEDNDKLSLTTGAVLTPEMGFGKILDLSSGWDNKNQNHAFVKDAKGYFNKTEFTVLLDVNRSGAPGASEVNDKSVAMTIGSGENALRLLTLSDKFGYGGDNGGVSNHFISLEGIEGSGWNSVAMTYQEKDGQNGSVVIYANGQKVGEVADVGFKLSQMENPEAMLGRSFNTNYMLTGRYDNIVVLGSSLDETTACAETAWRRWRKLNPPSPNDPEVIKKELQALMERIQRKLDEDKAAGILYAEEPLAPGQYTGAGAPPKDNLKDLDLVMKQGDALLQDENSTNDAMKDCMNQLNEIVENLRVIPGAYVSIPGQKGSVILADTGLPMQAHGGSAIAMKEGTGQDCVNFDLDGDGIITEGKTVYLWYGENKTNNTRPVDGVRCYASTDLYNWKDRGNVLYLQNVILPVEESDQKAITNLSSNPGASGEGTTQAYNAMKLSQTNLETLKSWGKMETAPAGVSEEAFGNVKLFLRAYVTEFDKEPTGLYDTAWTAKTYDETPITASSFLYPDSKTQGTVQTTPLQLAFEGLYGNYCITERPKMIYNESTKKFIIVFHADGILYNNKDLNDWVAGGCVGNCSGSRYSRAMVGFAESETPFGPFKLVNMTRMNYDTSLHASRLGEARDMTVFVDKGVDKNGDHVDDAYVVYSSEMNAKLYVSLLNSEYTGPIAAGDKAEVGKEAAYRIVNDDSREAPAIMKYDGWYYLITSGTDGWNSTAHTYYRSQDMFSGWEKVGNPAQNDTGKCFDTQVTYVLPLDAENGKFIYMGDRWNGNNLTDSRTVWMPIKIGSDHTISILGESDWTVDRLDELTPVKINTKLPDVVYADGSNLPEELNVTIQGNEADYAVTWNLEKVNMGNTTITGTLPDCNHMTVECGVFVAPKNLIYFANMSDPTLDNSADYTKIVEANQESLKQGGAGDGVYSEETGFGYTGEAGKVRNTNVSIYESMRYAEAGNSIIYQFKLPGDGSTYKVYAGMFDPSSWYSGHKGSRYGDVSINGQIVTLKYQYLDGVNDTLVYEDVTPDEDGILTVTVAKNADSTKDVQLSFLMVEKVEEGTEPTSEPTTEPTEEPTTEPTGDPTTEPTGDPTTEPTEEPTTEPTGDPTTEPTGDPTTEPTGHPTTEPTGDPTTEPTGDPTTEPTGAPTTEPTGAPTTEPTGAPTTEPTGAPTTEPTGAPTTEPTGAPTTEPTGAPTTEPTGAPTTEPTGEPTTEPTEEPTEDPTTEPTGEPTSSPEPGDVVVRGDKDVVTDVKTDENTKFVTEDNQDVSKDIVIRAEVNFNPSQDIQDVVRLLTAESGSKEVKVIYYDIKAYESDTNNVVILVNGSVKLKFAYESGYSDKDEIIVLHGTEQVPVEKEADCFWITATGFSPYTIIYKASEEVNGDEDDGTDDEETEPEQDKATSPKTYDGSGFERILPSDGLGNMRATGEQDNRSSMFGFVLAAILFGASAAVFGILAVRRKKED